jgi:hypothetical protein
MGEKRAGKKKARCGVNPSTKNNKQQTGQTTDRQTDRQTDSWLLLGMAVTDRVRGQRACIRSYKVFRSIDRGINCINPFRLQICIFRLQLCIFVCHANAGITTSHDATPHNGILQQLNLIHTVYSALGALKFTEGSPDGRIYGHKNCMHVRARATNFTSR